MTALTATGFSGFVSFRAQSNAVSETAERIKKLYLAATSHARDNASDWRALTKTILEEVAVEHGSPNWDGYGAQPVSERSKEYAQTFIDLMPRRFPAPDVVPDPDGDIALSWDFGPGHIFTMSISPAGVLSYAGLFGEGGRRHGVEPFKGNIPKTVLDSIEELCDRTGSAC